MKVCFFLVLTLGMSYGLERPSSDKSLEQQETGAIDLSRVKPINESDIPREQKKKSLRPELSPKKNSIPEVQQMAWLGVGGDPISDTLKSHLGITSGLVVKIISEGSPADLGGLKKHDIILKVDESEISNQASLAQCIQSYKADETIKINLLSSGKERTISVTLGNRKLPVNFPSSLPDVYERPMNRSQNENTDEKASSGKRGLGRMLLDMGFNKLLKEADPSNSFNMNFKSTSNVRIHDGEGSVEIEILNGDKNVIVRDKAGNVQYKGAWNTEEEKNLATPEIKDRVENIKFNFLDHNLGFGRNKKSEIK